MGSKLSCTAGVTSPRESSFIKKRSYFHRRNKRGRRRDAVRRKRQLSVSRKSINSPAGMVFENKTRNSRKDLQSHRTQSLKPRTTENTAYSKRLRSSSLTSARRQKSTQFNKERTKAVVTVRAAKIVDCGEYPEMSTIRSLGSLKSSLMEGNASSHAGKLSQADKTLTDMAVPPNSINSQFMSGITPLSSCHEQDHTYEDENDSVFEHDTPSPASALVYYQDFSRRQIAHYAPSPLTNNNSLITYSATNDLTHYEPSEGPGIDSDFGASAGVEMRIVSSDYSNANNTTAQYFKIKGNSISSKKRAPRAKKMRRRASPRDNLRNNTLKRDSGGNSVVYLGNRYTPRKISFITSWSQQQREFIQPQRPATAPPVQQYRQQQDGSLGMEWDDYDVNGYPAGPSPSAAAEQRWMEYIIPGITYPSSIPVLQDKQHWV